MPGGAGRPRRASYSCKPYKYARSVEERYPRRDIRAWGDDQELVPLDGYSDDLLRECHQCHEVGIGLTVYDGYWLCQSCVRIASWIDSKYSPEAISRQNIETSFDDETLATLAKQLGL